MIHYRPVTLDDYQEVKGLLEACGLEGRHSEESRLRRMIDNADRTVGAFEGERLVGFASALCDEAFYGYIGTVCVHPAHRRQGTGTELINQLTEDSPEITWLVRATHQSAPFWQRHGFTHSEVGMEKLRER
ncbi:MAG TPA: GNAT family N-acetyltransferase [Chloroflexia bacterium]|nr:GNAT family N-acetyltransferase [Chloroflexia bacterium]